MKTQVSHPSKTMRLKPIALAIGILQLVSTFAYAAEPVNGAPDADQSTTVNTSEPQNGIQEVIVTARKVGEPISKTPLAITAITGEDLKENSIVSVANIGEVVPNLVIGRDGFGVNINIRGVTTTDQTSKGTQGIGFNVDGVPIGRPLVQGLSFFDVERVEVLSGPQGTLYGTSTTGGAINVITNKPGKEFAASAGVELGNYNTKRADAVVNAPVNKDLAIRVALNSNDRDGYLEPTLGANPGGPARNDQHDRAGRVSALYNFNPETNLLVATTFGDSSGVGYGVVPNLNTLQDASGTQQRQVFGNPFGGNINDHFNNYNLEFNTLLANTQLTAIAASNQYHARELTSGTGDPLGNTNPFGDPQYAWRNCRGDFKETNAELRLTNATPSVFNWVAGVNFHNEKINESDHNLNALVSNPTVDGSTNGIDPLNTTKHKSSGVFGQGTYKLSDTFSVLIGLRETSDSTERVGTFAAGPSPTCTNPYADCVGGPNNGSESANKLTYRLGANYQFTPTQLLYAAVATGYKPGGFNDFDPVTKGTGPYEAEQLTAYEIGYKASTNTTRFTSDFFYYDYTKDQISSLSIIDGNFVIYTHPAPATLYGWENAFKVKLSNADQLTGSLSFMHSEFKHLMTGIMGNVDFTGKSLDKTPAASATLGYTHNFELQSGTVRTYLGTKYSSSYQLTDFIDGVQNTQKAFTRSNANITYLDQNGRFSAQLFVTNIENKLQMTSGPSSQAHPSYSVSEPRFIGVRIGVNY
ncbi:TonB-dependent receptor [Sapientia aquatica]|uniref:TonB-dependent receptor n=1 Tax=Sapientia aquatica TaxID=1549640 RepID=A0A4R5W1D7_9BURK|nr:TonB-dependent receptor [Sapientia aquatica]TDK65903.1 TonB-dependent receptor [Sapientia aquatica]